MNTSLASQLTLPSDLTVNEKNFLMMDMNIICLFNSNTTVHPPTQTYPFVSDSKITVEYDLIGEVIDSSGTFLPSYVYRHNTYVFYPGTMVYLLFYRDELTFQIYVMQVFTNKVNADITIDKVSFMSDYVTFPAGWSFGYYMLQDNQFLRMQSKGKATVVSDTLRNAYMLLSEEDGADIYAQYK